MFTEDIVTLTAPGGYCFLAPKPSVDPCLAWFAVRVRTRSESGVASALAQGGYECFTPTYIARRRYSDRIKEVESALFTGYVFCRFHPGNLLPILTTPGVQGVVSFGKKPEPVPEACIRNLRLAVLHGLDAEPAAYLRIGQRVRVLRGALAGIEGFLVEAGDEKRLVISADIFCRALSIVIERDQVVPL